MTQMYEQGPTPDVEEVLQREPIMSAVPVTIQEPVDVRQLPAKRGKWDSIMLTVGTPRLVLDADPRVKRWITSVSFPTTPNTTTPAVTNQVPLAASGVAAYNNNPVGVIQNIAGGTVTVIAVNGVTTGVTSGAFFVPAGGTITVTYTVAPTTYNTTGVPVAGTLAATAVVLGSESQIKAPNGPYGFFYTPGSTPPIFEGISEETWGVALGPVNQSAVFSFRAEAWAD